MLKHYVSKRNILPNSPNEYYREHMQALIDSRWENTSTLYAVQEEYPYASLTFRDVEVHMTHALDKSTNKKQGDDFRELIFKDINYNVRLGNYYKFDNANWLVINLDEANRTSKNIIIRRCNNFLKWKDAEGSVYAYPCILEYDATSSSPLIDNNIITPNNKVRVIIQANPNTLGLKVNTRFIFANRPFKIIGYNNYMINTIGGEQSILYIETQLDEISPYDDFVNEIAYNKEIKPTPTPIVIEDGIVIEPVFDFIRQNYTMQFDANYYIDNVKQEDVVTCEASGAPDWTYEFVSLGDNKFSLKCKKISQIPLQLTFICGDITKVAMIELKSMF
jgi:hypothetical protein